MNKVRVVEKPWASDPSRKKWSVQIKKWFFWYETTYYLYSKQDAIEYAKSLENEVLVRVIYETES